MENWGRLSHLFVPSFLYYFCELMESPVVPEVTLAAVCPGEDECSAAIYFTGFQQAIGGIGSVIMMPLIGNLSDAYGRKNLMMIPLVLAIFPNAILAWKRTTNFFYAYYIIKTLSIMVTKGGFLCLSLAYLADNVSGSKRVSAFGVLSGVMYAAYLGGTFASRVLSTTHIFQVAAALSIVAAIYTMIFLKETTRQTGPLEHPILRRIENDEDGFGSSKNKGLIGKIPSPRVIVRLLRSSATFSLAALVAFFNNLAEGGLQVCLLYFLKARFHFGKDQLADILLIGYIGATISNMLVMPILGPRIGEEILLALALFAGFLIMFLDGIAWAAWVPYVSSSMGFFLFLASPALRSIVSKQVGPNEQGLAQGSILGISSLANIISPLIYSPLSALFLSEKAPFHFQGFSLICVGLAWLVSFFLSIMIPILSRNVSSNQNSMEA
ncbi:putative transporter ADD1 (major facilitator superfamily) [Handroanthus impetiginosus]|uniref:Putative transporter ADD1 (Major facilitator superfamily) n=1 Tax=Handroanthus impetiginosus TaxID=429701 RepID=A0A2G9GW69_9LAMI|nr:putative transporter ADD1 (major facilitator superfamily) [Handroanthus impetiginosus]